MQQLKIKTSYLIHNTVDRHKFLKTQIQFKVTAQPRPERTQKCKEQKTKFTNIIADVIYSLFCHLYTRKNLTQISKTQHEFEKNNLYAVCACISTCGYMCVCRPEVDVDVFLSYSLPWTRGQGLLLTRLVYLASFYCNPVCLQGLGLQAGNQAHLAFIWVLGIQTLVLISTVYFFFKSPEPFFQPKKIIY